MCGADRAETIHIAGYQPDYSLDKYCEELPATGKTILAFDLETPSLRGAPIEIRIVKDPMAPLSESADLDRLTEAYLAPQIYPSGTFYLEHVFKESGQFAIVLAVASPNGEKKTTKLKLSVGQTFRHLTPLVLGGALIAAILFAYWRHGGRRSRPAPASGA